MAANDTLFLAFSLLLLPPLSSAFSPIFLNCGSSSSIILAGDNPSRTFTPDESYLVSPSNSQNASNSTLSSVPSIYSTARVFSSPSSYKFNVEQNAFYILRLHFLAFPSTSAARFNVSALSRYLLLSSASLPFSSSSTKEFILWVDATPLLLTFSPSPDPDSLPMAFINAIELIPYPPNLINSIQPFNTTKTIPSAGNFFPRAMETVYRINVGGPHITPTNDTLWRTWEPDDSSSFKLAFSSTLSASAGQINYTKARGLTPEIAPPMVYSTARSMNATFVQQFVDFSANLTWSFNTSPGFQYFIRMHFCNNWFRSQIFFEVYINEFLASKDLNTGTETDGDLSVPFYLDFVLDAPSSGGPLNVSIGTAENSVPRDAILNGLEIMKLNNSFLSLADPFGVLDTNNKRHGKNHLVQILLPSILGGLLLFVLLLVFVAHPRREKPKAEKYQTETTPVLWSECNDGARTDVPILSGSNSSAISASPRLKLDLQIPFAVIASATSNFDEKLVIGSGGFGKVYKGVLRDGTMVAVKRFMPGNHQGYPEFQTEIVLLSRIRHRHLVSLIGYCVEQSEMILVYENMEKGTLRSHLYGSENPCLSWKQRLEICIGAARGLHYLHTGYAQSIIHRDVKSTNILLGENFAAKLSDFGLSRLGPSFGETHVSTNLKGTFGYFDPEYYKIQKLTEKSDVYSFGVVLFEVLCARPAIDGHVNLAELALSWHRKGQLEKIIDQRLMGRINEMSMRKFGETAASCLANHGADRPSMADVMWNLEYALQLQETHLRREPYEDSGAVDESQIAVSPGRSVPSSTELTLDVGGNEQVAERTLDVSDVTTSVVFSQLVTGEGR